jgi:serine/threonine protein kinase
MEYQYYPIIKHITYFILIYLFLRHQKIMANDILLINSVILTLFMIIVDHMFINNHPSPFDKSDDYIDEDEVKKIKKKIKKEKKKNKQKKSDNKLINELSSKEEIDKHINRILDEDENKQNNSHEEVSDNYRKRIISQQSQQQKENFDDFIGSLDNIETFNPTGSSYNNISNDIEPFNVLGYNE